MAPGFCLCPLRGCPSVSVCLPHVRLLPRPSVQFSSVWIPEPPFPPPRENARGGCWFGKRARVRVVDKTRASGGRGVGTLLSSFALTTCLASFPSAQHWGGRFLGGNREGPYRLVPS